jgi:hypothetical protein
MNEQSLEKNVGLIGKLAAPVALACGLALAAGCASAPKEKAAAAEKPAVSAPSQGGMTQEQVLNHEDVKGKPPTGFQQPLDKTREATLRALTFVGCEVKKNQTYYVSGRRPNKMGLFVGSGGETVEVFLNPKGEKETEVWVDTDLSFVGLAGQQDWSKQVMQEITNILNKPESKP